MTVPFITHSEITDTIYIVCGTSKYIATEQVIKAMRETGRLEPERPHGEWRQISECDYNCKIVYECSICRRRQKQNEFKLFNYCPNCGADMRKEGEE